MQDIYGRNVKDIGSDELVAGMSEPVKKTSQGGKPNQDLEALSATHASLTKLVNELADKVSNLPEDSKEYEEIVKALNANKKEPTREPRTVKADSKKTFESAIIDAHKKTDVWGGRIDKIDKFLHEAVTGHSLHVHDYTVAKILEEISRNVISLTNHLRSTKGSGTSSGTGSSPSPHQTTNLPPDTVDYVNDGSGNPYDGASSEWMEEQISWMEQNGADTTEMRESLDALVENNDKNAVENQGLLKLIDKSLGSSLHQSRRYTQITLQQNKSLKDFWMSGNSKVTIDGLEQIDEHLASMAAMTPHDRKVTKNKLEAIDKAIKEKKHKDADELTGSLLSEAKKQKERGEGWVARKRDSLDASNDKIKKFAEALNMAKPSNIGIGRDVDFIKDAGKMRDFSAKLDTQLNSNFYASTGQRGSLNPHEQVKEKAGEANQGYYSNLTSLTENFLDTGVSRDELEKIGDTYNNNLTRGIKQQKQLYTVTRAGLGVADLIGASVEETSDMFAEWNQHFDYSNEQMYLLSNTLTGIARKTGLSGKNLMQVATNSKSFAEDMRNAGTYSDTALKNIMQISAEAQKKGVDQQARKVLEAINDPSKLMTGEVDDQTRNLVYQASQGTGNDQDFQKLMDGTLTQDAEAMNRVAIQIEKLASRTDGLTGQARIAADLGLKSGYGMRSNEMKRVAEAMREGSMTSESKQAKLENDLKTKRLSPDKRSDLENQIAMLKNQAFKDKSDAGLTALSDISGSLGDKSLSMKDALEKAGGKDKVMSQIGDMKKALEQADKSKMNKTELAQRDKMMSLLDGLDMSDEDKFVKQAAEILKESQKTQIAEKNLGTSKSLETQAIQEQRTADFQKNILEAVEKIKGWGDATTFANVNTAAGIANNLTQMLDKLSSMLGILTVLQSASMVQGMLGQKGAGLMGGGGGKGGFMRSAKTIGSNIGAGIAIEGLGRGGMHLAKQNGYFTDPVGEEAATSVVDYAAMGAMFGPLGAVVGAGAGFTKEIYKAGSYWYDTVKETRESETKAKATQDDLIKTLPSKLAASYQQDIGSVEKNLAKEKKAADDAMAQANFKYDQYMKETEGTFTYRSSDRVAELKGAQNSAQYMQARVYQGNTQGYRDAAEKNIMDNLPTEFKGRETELKPLIQDYVEKRLQDMYYGDKDSGTKVRLAEKNDEIRKAKGLDLNAIMDNVKLTQKKEKQSAIIDKIGGEDQATPEGKLASLLDYSLKDIASSGYKGKDVSQLNEAEFAEMMTYFQKAMGAVKTGDETGLDSWTVGMSRMMRTQAEKRGIQDISAFDGLDTKKLSQKYLPPTTRQQTPPADTWLSRISKMVMPETKIQTTTPETQPATGTPSGFLDKVIQRIVSGDIPTPAQPTAEPAGASGVSDDRTISASRAMREPVVENNTQMASLDEISRNTEMSAEQTRQLREFLEKLFKENAGTSKQTAYSTTNSRMGSPPDYWGWGGGKGQNANWGPPNPSPIGNI